LSSTKVYFFKNADDAVNCLLGDGI